VHKKIRVAMRQLAACFNFIPFLPGCII